MSTELAGMKAAELKALLDDLANRDIHVAFEGDAVMGCGGPGTITRAKSSVEFMGRAVATVGASYRIPACSHGCMTCPHDCSGTLINGLPEVTADGVPVAIVGSRGTHAACCGPNKALVAEGYRYRAPPGDLHDVIPALPMPKMSHSTETR